jgi:serine/threonine-protein kinase
MHKIRLEKFPSPRKLNPEIPRELERIMARCMEKLPRDRYRSTQDLVLAFERFLSRRVEMNYHARVVLFLKNQGVITPEEAEQYLNPAVGSASGAVVAPTQTAARALIRRVATAQAVIVGAVALTVGLIHLAPVGANPEAALGLAPAEPVGYLRLVAHPWAHVYIDGEKRETTPFAAPIDVTAGRHKLTLKNDYFPDIVREIEVPEGTKETAKLMFFDFERPRVARRPSGCGGPRTTPGPSRARAIARP